MLAKINDRELQTTLNQILLEQSRIFNRTRLIFNQNMLRLLSLFQFQFQEVYFKA